MAFSNRSGHARGVTREVHSNAEGERQWTVRAVPGRWHLSLEEGTLSGWLNEMLEPHVAEGVVVGVSESRGYRWGRSDPYHVMGLRATPGG